MSDVNAIFDELEVPPTRSAAPKPRARKPRPEAKVQQWISGAGLEDFHAYMPGHTYLFVPTRELWPAASVNGKITDWPTGTNSKKIKPSDWLDRNRPVDQMVWDPSEPMLITGKVMQVSGYAKHDGATVFNLYRPPAFQLGEAGMAGPWRDHLRIMYPDDADHIEQYLAYKVQNPGGKINHAIVLGGAQGVGKDTLLVPVRQAIGPWNCQDVSPSQTMGRFNGFAKSVLMVISEARDLGDVDRFAFYDHTKTYMAAPPDVIRVDEKNLREHYVVNVCGVVITTNHKTDGLYVPADDRRHYIAWSNATREQFSAEYWTALYRWYQEGGTNNVIAHLLTLDLSAFDPKAPPPKTPAFWAVVQANEAPESGELRDVIDALPPSRKDAFTVVDLIDAAEGLMMVTFADELKDRRHRRAIPHKMERVGYMPVRNPDADDGLFKIGRRRQVVYAAKKLSLPDQIKAARHIGEVVDSFSLSTATSQSDR